MSDLQSRPVGVGRRRLCLACAALPAIRVGGVAAAPLAVGDRLTWPTLTFLDGSRLAPVDWHDTAAVVVLWQTTCPFCRRHNAHVEKLHRAAVGTRLRVISAAVDRDAAAVRQYMASQGYTFPVTLQEPELRRLFTSRRVIPLTCVIDRAGQLRDVIPGEMFEEDVLELARWAQSS